MRLTEKASAWREAADFCGVLSADALATADVLAVNVNGIGWRSFVDYRQIGKATGLTGKRVFAAHREMKEAGLIDPLRRGHYGYELMLPAEDGGEE